MKQYDRRLPELDIYIYVDRCIHTRRAVDHRGIVLGGTREKRKSLDYLLQNTLCLLHLDNVGRDRLFLFPISNHGTASVNRLMHHIGYCALQSSQLTL